MTRNQHSLNELTFARDHKLEKDLIFITKHGYLNEGITVGGKGRNLRLIADWYVPDYIIIPAETEDVDAVVDMAYRRVMDRWNCRHYAVRSSAECEDGKEQSYAGVFDSYLDVPLTSLAHTVRRVRNSVTNIEGVPPKMGVIIMPMIHADISGVLFSKEPVEGTNRMLVEYERGAGGVVDGTSNTTQLFLDSENLFDMSESIGIGNYEIADFLFRSPIYSLWREAKRLESTFNSPVDIEWAMTKADRKLHILQVRPITAMKETA